MRGSGLFATVASGLVAVLVALPANTQSTDESVETAPAPRSGQVESSPIPRIRIIRPATTAPDDTASDGSNTGDGTQPIEVRTLPTVRRAGETTNPDQTFAAPTERRTITAPSSAADGAAPTGTAADGTTPTGDGNTRVANVDPSTTPEATDDSRFKQAPPRTSKFDPAAPSPIAPIRQPRTKLREAARLRQLDKMTGTTVTYDVAVGEDRQVARLKIRLDACRSPGDNDTHGTMAFLKIWDTKHPDRDAAFSGWMFAESPALSALDHPRYDLWVISCTTLAGE